MLHQAPRPVRMAQTARRSCVGSDRALQRARQALMAFMGSGFFSLRHSLIPRSFRRVLLVPAILLAKHALYLQCASVLLISGGSELHVALAESGPKSDADAR